MKLIHVILLSFYACFHLFAQHGVSPRWSSPIPLPQVHPSYAANTTVGTSMVVDKRGTLYLFYREYHPDTASTARIYINTSTDGASWTPQLFSPAQQFVPGYYNAGIDTADNIHVVWVRSATRELMYSKYDAAISSWLSSVRLHQTTNQLLGTSITIDKKMRVHVSWFEDVTAGAEPTTSAEIFYLRSTTNGSSWTEAVKNISNTAGQASAWQRGDFSGTASDTLAYAWRENTNPSGGANWDIMLASTTDGGATWTTRTVPSASGIGQQRDPVLAVLDNHSVVLAYEEWPAGGGQKKIYFGATPNVVTTDPVMTVVSDTVESELLIDAYDKVNNRYWILWKWRYSSEASGHLDIAARAYTPGSHVWNEIELVSDIGSAEMGFKKCAVGSDGTLHVVYGTPPTGKTVLYYTARTSSTTVAAEETTPPTEFLLYQNYPNPFNPTTTISFALPFSSFVTLKIFDALGREVSTIVSEDLSAGTYKHKWNASGLPSGIFFYRLQAGSFAETKKLTLIR